MQVAFSQFCGASPAYYDALRRCAEVCARQGRSYEFSDCEMPSGCEPGRVSLGFARQADGAYLLYWRPDVRYLGESGVLRILFSRSVWRFDSFEAMTARLCSLRTAAGAQPSFDAQPAPVSEAREAEPLDVRLARELSLSVMGQEHAVEAAAYRLYAHVGKRSPARPLSLIFYGPTGVGKSELGKAIAPALERCCGQRYQFVWTELNTFTQPHSVHRLIGAPPGYVGYDDPPVFEAVRENPRTVFMFDELEKAHPEVLKIFLSILDEGRCTARRADESGSRELDFRRCILVFTTNADLSESGARRPGFSVEAEEKKAAVPANLAERLYAENESARRAMIRHGVLTEIAGRFTGLIGFTPLSGEARCAVTVKQLRALGREYGVELSGIDRETARSLTPGADALSVRSSVGVLEGLLTPLLTRAAGSGVRTARLSGTPGALQLTPVGHGAETSTTVLLSRSSR